MNWRDVASELRKAEPPPQSDQFMQDYMRSLGVHALADAIDRVADREELP